MSLAGFVTRGVALPAGLACAAAAFLAQGGRFSGHLDILTHFAPLYLLGGTIVLALAFLLISMYFVWRSFYRMRIDTPLTDEADTPASTPAPPPSIGTADKPAGTSPKDLLESWRAQR